MPQCYIQSPIDIKNKLIEIVKYRKNYSESMVENICTYITTFNRENANKFLGWWFLGDGKLEWEEKNETTKKSVTIFE